MVLGTAVMAAKRRNDSHYDVYYRRRAARRGKQRALVAVMHKFAIAILHVLHDHADLGADDFARRDPARVMHRMVGPDHSA
ncbi:hypothetical protein AB0D13_10230 [Streptomyces sp. NPDC048430]|uniref:hypothetical protein n=1 Tax=Streptomyces sp. NPDC048430 TaxID=3155388 RepID=UPI00343B46C4